MDLLFLGPLPIILRDVDNHVLRIYQPSIPSISPTQFLISYFSSPLSLNPVFPNISGTLFVSSFVEYLFIWSADPYYKLLVSVCKGTTIVFTNLFLLTYLWKLY